MKDKIARLKSGDSIAVVNIAAPEPALFPERLDFGVSRLRDMGFRVVEANHLRKKEGFFSDHPKIVAEELNALWRDESIKAIVCAGGGVAGNAILPFLNYELFSRKPKILLGASNPTVVLNAISKVSGVITFHGPSIVWDFGDPDQPAFTRENFLNALVNGEQLIGHIPEFLRDGEASGTLFGGNLSSIMELTGTSWFPNFENGIFAWEEIDEDAEHIFSKLNQLAQIGVMEKLNGMIIGELVEGTASQGVTIREAVLDVCDNYSFPIAWDLPFGHTAEKCILPIGAEVTLSSMTSELSIQSAVFS